MKLFLKRIFKGKDYTIGKLYIDNKYFCDTLEDTVRFLRTKKDKVYDHTAIPAGNYKIILSYSSKFKRKLPEILNVPFFTGIRIHRGNYPKDTLGCILVGFNTKKGMVTSSTVTEKKLIALMENQNDISIEIV